MKQTGHIQTGLFHLVTLLLKRTILKGPLQKRAIIELSCVHWTNFDSKKPNSLKAFQTVNGVLQNCPRKVLIGRNSCYIFIPEVNVKNHVELAI